MMPLCYGGGVKTVEQAQRIFSLGIEKDSFEFCCHNNPNLITRNFRQCWFTKCDCGIRC